MGRPVSLIVLCSSRACLLTDPRPVRQLRVERGGLQSEVAEPVHVRLALLFLCERFDGLVVPPLLRKYVLNREPGSLNLWLSGLCRKTVLDGLKIGPEASARKPSERVL